MCSKVKSVFLIFWVSLFTAGLLMGQSNILVNGDFETYEPAFWNKLNAGMGTLTWATDEAAPNPWNTALGSERSLKVEKASATADMVGWKSDNNAFLYWNNAAGNTLYTLRFWAKTSGVNTSPGNQDEMIGVWYQFYEGGSLIGEQFVGVDQSVASKDWTEYTGGILVSGTPEEVYAVAVMEKNATGTVWFDNIDCWTDPWSIGIFNADAETPVGWMYWTDANKIGFAGLVSDTVHGGSYSVLMYENDTQDDELVFYSEPVSAQPDKWYKIGVWIKTDSVNNNPLYYPTNVIPDRDNDRLGVTFFFHRAPIGTSWDLTGGDQFFYVDQRNAETGWTHYVVVAKAPSDAAGVSVRARFTSFPTGYAWYDDFIIQEATPVTSIEDPPTPVSLLSTDYRLFQNYPNPFNPITIIEYEVPRKGPVELSVYNMLGQKIRTLVKDHLAAGTYQVQWDGTDEHGRTVASGVYLYQLKGDNALITKKMTFLK